MSADLKLWHVKGVVSRRAVLEINSGPPLPPVTQLLALDEVLANAVEFTTWSREPTQVELCSECGNEGCSTFGWVWLRRSGERLVWLPSFDDELEKRQPPPYFFTKGVPMFEPEAARVVRDATRLSWNDVAPLKSHDIVSLVQWSAPDGLLGHPRCTPAVRREDVLAVSSGERLDVIQTLEDRLMRCVEAESEVLLAERPKGAEPITFFLDLPGHPEWVPLLRIGDELLLSLGELVVLTS